MSAIITMLIQIVFLCFYCVATDLHIHTYVRSYLWIISINLSDTSLPSSNIQYSQMF